jgi:quercetin dioxygenase-like cupin family protein
MEQSEFYQLEEETHWEFLGNGISRKIFGYNEQIMLVKVRFEKGAIGQLHNHHHTQVTYVESGVFEMTIGNETRTIKSGDGFYVPPHVEHGLLCLEAGILIDVFNPMREDFLNKNS